MEQQFELSCEVMAPAGRNAAAERRRKAVEEQLSVRMAEASGRPSNIGFFEDALRNPHPKTLGTPRIGHLCNMIPQELSWALGCESVRLDCGNNASCALGDQIFAGEVCPSAKASLGEFLLDTSTASSCDAVVVAAGCDPKRKMGEILSARLPVFTLTLPAERDHARYAEQAAAEMGRLACFLEGIANRSLRSARLAAAVETSNRRAMVARRLQAARTAEPSCLSLGDIMIVIQSSMFSPLPIGDWLAEVGKTLREVEQRKSSRRSLRHRIVLTGSPAVWPNFKVLNLLEECGADVLADTLCTGVQSCFDPVVPAEHGRQGLLRALAGRYIFASPCPCFISAASRVRRLEELVRETRAAAVVNFSLRLCQLFDMENLIVEKAMKSKEIPYISVRTDMSFEDTEQLRVRIEAFLETLDD